MQLLRFGLAFSAVALLACSASRTDGTVDPLDQDSTSSGGDGFDPGEGGGPDFALPDGPVGPTCVGLECDKVKCADGSVTTISGKVYDPAGVVPLYNVIVYVPNAPLAPFPKGVSCDKCGALASGSPIVTALTDSKGSFVLKDVPVGSDIPLVMQVGKWRRKITIPTVEKCVDNPISKTQTRLPKSKAEGDIPQIALVTGGCDKLECLMRDIGIADSEFTDGSGSGRVHLYKGQGGGGVATSTLAQPFWSDAAQLKKYDIVILSCECSEYPTNKGAAALAAMHDYANAGGRIFATHYHYHWFKSGAADFVSTASWGTGTVTPAGDYNVDTTFPKGKSFADWLVAVGASTVVGKVPLSLTANDLTTVNKTISQRWIYNASPELVKYFSFNTPIGKPAEAQCGRAVFSDLHVSSETGGGVFPGACSVSPLTPQEKALEFLLFDLSSCIQKDGDIPTPPPVK